MIVEAFFVAIIFIFIIEQTFEMDEHTFLALFFYSDDVLNITN